MLQGKNGISLGIYPTSFTGDITEEVYRMISSSWDQKFCCLSKRTVENSSWPFTVKVEDLIYIPITSLFTYRCKYFKSNYISSSGDLLDIKNH